MATIRSAAMEVSRARDDGQAESGANDVFAEGQSLLGRGNNITMANIVPGVAEVFGQIGMVNWWDRTVTLSDFSFDSFEMNQAPVALGPGRYTFNILEYTDLLIDGAPQRIRYVVDGIIQPEHGNFDRSNAQNRSRRVVVKPTRLIEGGGASWKGHRDGITKPEHGASGDQYPFAYCDLEGVNGGALWVGKLPGLAAVQYLPMRTS